MTRWVEVEPIHLAAAVRVLTRQRARVSPFRRLPLYPKQSAIVDDPARFTICEATTKAGKNFSHMEWFLDGALQEGEGEHWWVAPVYAQASMQYRRTIDRLRGYVQKPDGDSFRLVKVADPIAYTQNKTDLVIETCGARLCYRSAEKPDHLFGDDVRSLVGDEISRWREEAWHAVYTTLGATKGRAKLIGNVKGRRNFSWALARKAEAGETDWSYHKLTCEDAIEGGVLDAEIVEQARRDLPDAVFRQLYMAEASDDEGNPFGVEMINARVAPLSTWPAVVYGWDVAKSVDWTVGVGLDRFGKVAEFHRFQRDWTATRDDIKRISRGVPCVVDATGVGSPVTEDLQRAGLDVEGYIFSARSKQQLMEGLRNALHTAETSVLDGVMRNELEAFEYEYTSTGVRYSAPSGMHDDAVCALALAVYAYRSKYRAGFTDLEEIFQLPSMEYELG